MRHFIYFLYLGPCLDLGLVMSYLCVLFFFSFSIFIMINRIILSIQTHLFFCLFLEYVLLFLDDYAMKNVNNFQIAKVQPQGVA